MSLSFPLSGSPFCCLPVHSVVSLSILLSPYPFSHLPVHSVVSLSILLFYREEAKARGRIRTEVVNFRSVVFTGIVFHGRYHRSLFNKVCLICPSDVLFKKIMSQIFNCASRNLLLSCPQPKNGLDQQRPCGMVFQLRSQTHQWSGQPELPIGEACINFPVSHFFSSSFPGMYMYSIGCLV